MTAEARQPLYSSRRWKQLRKAICKRDPVCHWCKVRPSEVADHLEHRPDNATFFEPRNLVGACWTCNSTRAARKRHQLNDNPTTIAKAKADAVLDQMLADLRSRLKP